MADYASAATAIRRLALQLQGMSDAADILEMIGPPTQALAEINAQLTSANTTLAEKQQELQNAVSSIAQVQANADSIVRQANADAEDIRQQAENDAKTARDFALGEIVTFTAKAKSDASGLLQQALADAQGRLANLSRQTADAQQAANDAIAMRDTAQQALDNINQRIADAKARLQAALDI